MKCCWILWWQKSLLHTSRKSVTDCSPANKHVFLSCARMTLCVYNTDNYFAFYQIVSCRTLLFHTKEDLLNVAQAKITVTNTFTPHCHRWKIEVRGSKSRPKLIFSCCCSLSGFLQVTRRMLPWPVVAGTRCYSYCIYVLNMRYMQVVQYSPSTDLLAISSHPENLG